MKLLNGAEGQRRSRGRRLTALDAATRARGLAGVAEARRALQKATPPTPAEGVPLRQAS